MRRRMMLASVVVAATLGFVGCTPPAAEPTAWQGSVETVADQAAAGDYAGALASLDALEAEVVARRDAGEIPADEAERILAAIAAVRADLTSLVSAPSPTPESTPTEEQTQEPVQTQEPAPQTPATETDDGGDDSIPEQEEGETKEPKEDKSKDDPSEGGNTGPGNNNGNGNGSSSTPGGQKKGATTPGGVEGAASTTPGGATPGGPGRG